MNVTERLDGDGGLDGVRWLFAGRPARRLLRRELGRLLERADLLGPCRLRRVKYKPAQKLSAYYDLELRDGEGRTRGSRPVAVTWVPAGDGDGGERVVTAELQDEAVRRGLAAPFRALEAEVPDWGMRILVSPLDERFPQLARLSDLEYLADVLHVRITAVTPIRYRPGQRHVLRYDVHGAPDCVFAKVYENDEGTQWGDVAAQVAAWLESNGDGFRASRPLTYLARDHAVLYAPVPGRPLSTLLRRGRAGGLLLARAGDMLHTLHSAPPSLSEALPPHDFQAEARATARAAEHVDALLPATAETIRALLERARALHEQLPREAPIFTHGDFKADHLWADADRLTLIDFDRCRRDDPAADVGKLLADLHWWNATEGAARAQEHFLAGYAEHVPPARLRRARVYEAMLLVKVALRRLPLFDPRWAERTIAAVALADAKLNALERGSARRPDGRAQRRATAGRAATRPRPALGSAGRRS